MTTFTIYADTNDHEIDSYSNVSYATARAGSGTKDDAAGSGSYKVGQYYGGGYYGCKQVFLSFDTSSLPASAPNSNKLQLMLAASPSVSKTIDAAENTWSGGTGDFIAGASLSSLTAFGSRAFTSGESATLKDINGPTSFARSAAYKLILYAHDQQTNTTPSAGEEMWFWAADASGTTNDPRLSVWFQNTTITASKGSFALTGKDALLTAGRVVKAATGSFSLTGFAIALGIKRYPPPERTITFSRNTLEDRTLEL